MQHLHLHNKSYSFEQLPSIPSLLIELIDLCHADTCNFDKIASTVQKDSALTAKIFQIANSALFRPWNDATDIRRMLIVLGMDNVRQIVITTAIQQFFANFSKDFDRAVQRSWFRAMYSSNLAQRLAQLIGYQHPKEAFLAGLLYQVGQLLLLLNHEADYRPLLDQYDQASDFCALERNMLDIDHCELGAALVESWQLESFIADAILFQKAPTEEIRNAPTLIKLIAVTSALCRSGNQQVSRAAIERAGELFDLTESSTFECLVTAKNKTRQTIKELGFDDIQLDDNGITATETYREEKTRKEFSQRIKDLALANSRSGPLPADHEATKQLRVSVEILFNIKSLFLIRPSSDSHLEIVNDLALNRLDQITFNPDDPSSLLVKAYNSQTMVNSFNTPAAIIDKQLLRVLGTEGALFLPLQYKSKIGVIALGLNKTENLQLSKKTTLLRLFINNIARDLLPETTTTLPLPETGISYERLKELTHEMSNPLTIIKNYLYVLGKKLESKDDVQEEIDFINEEIDRVGNILLRVKDPDSDRQSDSNQLDINKLLQDLDRIFRGSLYKTSGLNVTLQLDESLPPIVSGKDKLKQVLLNIIKNATEALQAGGNILIRTRDNVYQNDAEFVEITLQDDGPGIPHQVLQNLFKPVESTKQGHSGVGLSIVNSLISELGGTITCHSTPELGTEFKIYLPRTI